MWNQRLIFHQLIATRKELRDFSIQPCLHTTLAIDFLPEVKFSFLMNCRASKSIAQVLFNCKLFSYNQTNWFKATFATLGENAMPLYLLIKETNRIVTDDAELKDQLSKNVQVFLSTRNHTTTGFRIAFCVFQGVRRVDWCRKHFVVLHNHLHPREIT